MDQQPYAQIEHNMTNHPPDEATVRQMEDLRENFKETAKTVEDECPNSREKSIAHTKLEEALMWTMASLARHQGEDE